MSEIKTASKVVAIVDRYATKAEKDTLKTIKDIAKTADLEGISVRNLEGEIRAGLQGRDSVLKPSMAQNVRLMALLADIDGCPQKLGSLNTVATNVRKAYGAEKGAELVKALIGQTLKDLKRVPEGAENLFDAIAIQSKADSEKAVTSPKEGSRKPRPSEGASESEGKGEGSSVEPLPIDAQVIALAVALTQYAEGEGKMTPSLRKALDKLESALAEFAI